MKIRNLFILGLSAACLASCGGPKKYSNLVFDKEQFFDDLDTSLEINGFYYDDVMYSYVMEYEREKETVTSTLKNGKVVSKVTSEEEKEVEVKYDATSHILSKESESEDIDKSEHGKEKETYKEEHVYQPNYSGYASVDKLTKTYYEYDSSEPSDRIESYAVKETNEIFDYLSTGRSLLYNDQSKAYRDGNVFTVVLDADEYMNDKYIKGHVLIQLVVEANELTLYYESNGVTKDSKSTVEEEEKEEITFKRKNVSLKSVSLSSYVCLSEKY